MPTKHNVHYLRPIYSPETLTFCYIMPFFRVFRVFRAWLWAKGIQDTQQAAGRVMHAIQGRAHAMRVCRACRVQDELGAYGRQDVRSRQDEQDERNRQDERGAY